MPSTGRVENEPLLDPRASKEIEDGDDPSTNNEIVYTKQSAAYYRNFIVMCLAFSVNHGTVVSCLAYATTELGDSLGGFGSGCLYVMYALTALLIAKPIVAMVGPKNGLLAGIGGYCIYVGGFLFSILVPQLAWPVFLLSASIGGIAGGLLWPSQGKFFAKNAKLYSDVTGIPVDEVNSNFAGIFASCYLGVEMLTKVLATAIFLSAPPSTATALVFTVYTVLAVSCIFVCASLNNLDEPGTWDLDLAPMLTNAGAAMSLTCSDARLALMVPFQVAFGFTSGFVPFYVLGTIIAGSGELGPTYVGLLSAVIVLTGATMAMPAAWMANRFGKASVMTVGGTCLALAGAALYLFSDAQLGTWALIMPYLVIYGIGRGTWENTNKAVVADLFSSTPEHSTAAFASVAFFNGFAGAVGYFVFPNITRLAMASVVFVFALLGMVAYWASAALHASRRRQEKQEYDAASDVSGRREGRQDSGGGGGVGTYVAVTQSNSDQA